jgi:hypothetical protein
MFWIINQEINSDLKIRSIILNMRFGKRDICTLYKKKGNGTILW